MNIEPTSDQQALVDAVATLLRERLPVDRFLKTDANAATAATWDSLAELGLFGIALPEASGGIGLGLAEEVLVYREAGRYLVSPAAIATTIAARIAAEQGDGALVEALVSGACRVALAIPDAGSNLLIDSEGCSHVLVADRGISLQPRDAFEAGVALDALDGTLSLLRVHAVAAPGSVAFNAPLQLLVSAYLVGVAQGVRDTAVTYAGQREQFGRPIGSFQAIAHICAEMAVQSEAAWAQVLFAALVLQENQADPELHVQAARLLAVRAALLCARQAIQVHGGVGFTEEYTPHLYLKRAHLLERALAVYVDRDVLLDGGEAA